MSIRNAPFMPSGNGVTVNMVVANTGSAVQFDNILPGPGQGGFNKARSVRLFNAGPGLVFFELRGTQGIQTAQAATGVPLAPNTAIVLGATGGTVIAAITAGANTATLYATPGEGGI